jgi:hypothetical protein
MSKFTQWPENLSSLFWKSPGLLVHIPPVTHEASVHGFTCLAGLGYDSELFGLSGLAPGLEI